MDIEAAERHARYLMSEYGLTGWLFGWDDTAIRNGSTFESHDGTVKMIRLSRQLTSVRSVQNVSNTIMHEIAHALVGVEHGHDEVWTRKAKALGVMPTADSSPVLLARLAASR
jgi:hypothetical protein